ncbi:sulfatase-like hydrolase/transferase [Gracilibacillus sp. S3-1-1]|uniref:Sulfatase-like hydrolase/transferase n=1 Tax=Gracilibacillus pellucidus TaxID=3095368 RepID=A0ACC6M305_9BACI|nr:sulfatase-like hydrolase/transferase [Gracilibacillus sp. S3-1-1]MDX8045322.1 sulfatase-like hydrolase/transferase [Gracilibacillus sp. S3-1-1]
MNPPNILMITLDQWRYDWLGYAGKISIETPRIDSLIKGGTYFSQTVCNGSTCVPSRAAIYSGIYPHRLGVLTNEHTYPLKQQTFFQALRQNGYYVGGFGKLEFQKSKADYGEHGDSPVNYHLGFTHPFEVEGKMTSAKSKGEKLIGPYQRYLSRKGKLSSHIKEYKEREEKPIFYTKCSPHNPEDTLDQFIFDQAEGFIKSRSEDRPWFCGVNFVSPHDPWNATEEWFHRYKESDFPHSISSNLNDEMKPLWVRKRQETFRDGLTSEKMNDVKRHYAGMISYMDYLIGRLVDTLVECQFDQNTIIIITSDHGEMLGDHGLFRKQVMYEGSVRVPLVIVDPRKDQVEKVDKLTELVDLFPTILAFADIHSSQKIDGKSLLPLLTNENAQHKEEQLSLWENTEMLRTNQYKYIRNFNDQDELYDLIQDPFELHNIIEEENAVSQNMHKRLLELKGNN